MSPRVAERPLPNNIDAERAVLAAGLLDNAAVVEAANYVKREDFFHESNRLIFTTCQELSAEGTPVELVTVVDALKRKGKLEASGGAPYVSSLTDGFPKITNLPHYAKIIKDAARRRAVVYACMKLEEAAMQGQESAPKILEQGATEFLSLMSEEGAATMPSTWAEAVASAMDETIDAIRFRGNQLRMFCNIPKIDDATAGFRRKDVVLIVGATSHGKSLLASQFAVTADDAGHKGIIFSAEMSREALVNRELAYTADVPMYLLRRPELIHSPDSVIRDLTEAAAKESQRNLLIVDQDVTPKRIWSLCEMVKRSKGLDFVVVDYDQLVIRAALGNREDEFKAQARFMADALAMAKRLDLCFILLCQPHKLDDDVARGNKPPRVEQIFGSSATANTAHHILWVMRKYFTSGMDKQYEGHTSIYILKARNDWTGKLEIGFDYKKIRFVNNPVAPQLPGDTIR